MTISTEIPAGSIEAVNESFATARGIDPAIRDDVQQHAWTFILSPQRKIPWDDPNQLKPSLVSILFQARRSITRGTAFDNRNIRQSLEFDRLVSRPINREPSEPVDDEELSESAARELRSLALDVETSDGLSFYYWSEHVTSSWWNQVATEAINYAINTQGAKRLNWDEAEQRVIRNEFEAIHHCAWNGE